MSDKTTKLLKSVGAFLLISLPSVVVELGLSLPPGTLSVVTGALGMVAFHLDPNASAKKDSKSP